MSSRPTRALVLLFAVSCGACGAAAPRAPEPTHASEPSPEPERSPEPEPSPEHGSPPEPDPAEPTLEARVSAAFGATVYFREDRECLAWDVRAERDGTRRLSHGHGATARGYGVRLDGARMVVEGAFVGARSAECRVEHEVRAATADALHTGHGHVYTSRGWCVEGLAEGDPPLELGACAALHVELARPPPPHPSEAPVDEATTRRDPIERALRHGGTMHRLRSVGGALVCEAWRFTPARGRRGPVIAHHEGEGRSVLDVLGHAPGRIEVSIGWEGPGGTGGGMGDVMAWPVRYTDPRFAWVHREPWLFDAGDCEAARAAGGVVPWLRATTP